jgi:glycosyltransferase involved in cell wall biosynthesis
VYAIPHVKLLPDSFIFTRAVNLILDWIRRTRFTIRIFEKERYDIICALSEGVFDELTAAYIKRRYKTSFVFCLLNPLEQGGEDFKIEARKPRFLYYLLAKFDVLATVHAMKRADLVLSTPRFYEEALFKKGIAASKCRPYPSGVDPSFFLNENIGNVRQKYSLGDSKLIVYVGTLDKARCLHVLIQAFSRVKQERRSKLLIVGDGTDRENLERLAHELGIEEDVVFTGWVPESDLVQCIATADLGVSPVPPLSFYKVSSPIKVLEYLAMAKPVVASEEILDHREILEQSGGGILVPFTPEAFAKAIIYLLDNPQQAAEMGRRGREWVKKNRSYETLGRLLEKYCLEVIDDHD